MVRGNGRSVDDPWAVDIGRSDCRKPSHAHVTDRGLLGTELASRRRPTHLRAFVLHLADVLPEESLVGGSVVGGATAIRTEDAYSHRFQSWAERSLSLRLRQEVQAVLRRGDGGLRLVTDAFPAQEFAIEAAIHAGKQKVTGALRGGDRWWSACDRSEEIHRPRETSAKTHPPKFAPQVRFAVHVLTSTWQSRRA